ncbi:MAG: endolytic transglycosylase MltG [Burkholderiales bacterium]|nr:endolytic transglycosylase MltG [Burkholderiales bacterium]
MLKLIKALIFLVFLTLAGITGGLYWYAHHPLALGRDTVDLTVPRGASMRAAARLAGAALPVIPEILVLLSRLDGRDTRIKAGSYEIANGITPQELIDKLTRGDVTLQELTIPEGWTFRQFRAALQAHPGIRRDGAWLDDAELLRRIQAQEGGSATHPEGLFFPDTYLFAKGSDESEVLRRAYRAMQRRLAAAWQDRAAGVPLATPYQALVLASIIEKETGKAGERPLIAGVFVNRLTRGMLLQTDPTVIYGMGERFDGNLRRRDLLADTPYNTYTRAGLPPTPIALPGEAALRAALNPARTEAVYFVARGDGSHEFSATLEAHNRAVNRFQRRQGG